MKKKSTVARQIFHLVLITCLGLNSYVQSQGCTWTSPSGDNYDLSQLAQATDIKIPKCTYPNQGWDIYINACKSVTLGGCPTGPAACQNWGSGQASMGQADTITFSALSSGKGVTANYMNGTPDKGKPRNMEIDFICDPNGNTNSIPAYGGEDNTNLHYSFTWTSPYACPGSGPAPSGGSKSLTGGSIILIILLVLVVVYFVVGVVVQKFVRHQEGLEIIPNYQFWVSLPGLVKDGVMLIVNKTCRRGQGYSNV